MRCHSSGRFGPSGERDPSGGRLHGARDVSRRPGFLIHGAALPLLAPAGGRRILLPKPPLRPPPPPPPPGRLSSRRGTPAAAPIPPGPLALLGVADATGRGVPDATGRGRGAPGTMGRGRGRSSTTGALRAREASRCGPAARSEPGLPSQALRRLSRVRARGRLRSGSLRRWCARARRRRRNRGRRLRVGTRTTGALGAAADAAATGASTSSGSGGGGQGVDRAPAAHSGRLGGGAGAASTGGASAAAAPRRRRAGSRRRPCKRAPAFPVPSGHVRGRSAPGQRALMAAHGDIHRAQERHQLVARGPELARHIVYAKLYSRPSPTRARRIPPGAASITARIPVANAGSTTPTTAAEMPVPPRRPARPPTVLPRAARCRPIRVAVRSSALLCRDASGATTGVG